MHLRENDSYALDMKKLNNKGFTLAELLIVVAIIAVLVAIAIPIFNKQIEKSREAYDIYTMRQAASLAAECYYEGCADEKKAEACGLIWWENNGWDQANAAGVYDPGTGKFRAEKSNNSDLKYGKGTKTNGGTSFMWGNRQAYASGEDYRNAVVMIAIYPKGNDKHIDVYWKYSKGAAKVGQYVGDKQSNNIPKYSIKINLE